MPESPWAAQKGIKPGDLWISQIFTARKATVENLDYLISRPSPRDNPSGWGYGPITERATFTIDPSTNELSANPNDNRFGVFYDPSSTDTGGSTSAFFDHVHIRW